MKTPILLAAMLLAGCGGGGSQTPATPAAGPPSVWAFQYSPGMLSPAANGNGGFTFVFPGVDGVHYLVHGYSGALTQGLSIQYHIDVGGVPVFDYRTNPNNTCGPGFPGTATLYFQAFNDWNGEFGRWFAQGYARDLAPGTFEISAPVQTADKWVSVYGKTGVDAVSGWQAAINNVTSVGVVFGGGCFAGHGVFVTGGTATMAATEFTAR